MLNTRKITSGTELFLTILDRFRNGFSGFFLENDEYPSIILMVDSYILFTGYTVVHNCLPEAVREPNSLSTIDHDYPSNMS